jgi:hypothetical protein
MKANLKVEVMVAWKEMMMGAKMVEKSADWLESQLVENLVE